MTFRPALSALFERDGWARPFSPRAPLSSRWSPAPRPARRAGTAAERDGTLRGPVAVVSASSRDPPRCSSTPAPGRAPLGAAGRARRAGLGRRGRRGIPRAPRRWARRIARPEDDALLEDAGSLASPAGPRGVPRRPRGRGSEGRARRARGLGGAGAAAGDDSEAFLRDLASPVRRARLSPSARGDRRLARRLRRGAPGRTHGVGRAPRLAARARFRSPAPPPLGWRRASLRTEDERGGVELALPEARLRAGRALLFYRGDAGDFDAVPVLPGETRFLPAAGTSGRARRPRGRRRVGVTLRLRRAPEYPAALSAVRRGVAPGAVEVAWSTAQHRDLLAWVVERREEAPEGEGLPSARRCRRRRSRPDRRDTSSWTRDAAGARYRYRVLALTTDGSCRRRSKPGSRRDRRICGASAPRIQR